MTISHLKRQSSFAAALGTFAAAALLTACGGGSDSGSTNLTLKGTAATGAAMSGAAVTAQCATGKQSGTASASGAYTLVVPGGVLPCVLEAKTDDTTLYSMASGSGTEVVANITPITHAVVAKALGDEATVKATFAAPSGEALRAAASELAAALAAVRTALTGVADYSQDPFTTPFTAAHTGSDGKVYPGDTFDQQLDALQEKLDTAQSNLSQLVNAIATSQPEGATAPATNVVGVLTPPASTTCPNVRSGQYITASQRGELSTNGPGTFDASKMTWTTQQGTQTVTLTVELDSQCKVTLKNGTSAVISAVFNAQGMGIWRDLFSGGSDFGLVFPYQRNTLADLAGNWTMVAFDREDTDDTPVFGIGKATIEADGKWVASACSTNAGTATCGAWETAAQFSVNQGKFTNADGHGYLYKAPNGTKLYVHSFGEEYGLVVAAQPYTGSLPAVGSTIDFWNVSGSFISADPITSPATALTVASVDTANNSYTRSDGQVRIVQKPLEGMGYRANTSSTGNNAVIYLGAKGLLTVYGREKKDAYSFIGFSISK